MRAQANHFTGECRTHTQTRTQNVFNSIACGYLTHSHKRAANFRICLSYRVLRLGSHLKCWCHLWFMCRTHRRSNWTGGHITWEMAPVHNFQIIYYFNNIININSTQVVAGSRTKQKRAQAKRGDMGSYISRRASSIGHPCPGWDSDPGGGARARARALAQGSGQQNNSSQSENCFGGNFDYFRATVGKRQVIGSSQHEVFLCLCECVGMCGCVVLLFIERALWACA